MEGIQEEMNTENCQELNHLHVAQDHSKFHQPKAGKEREDDFHQLREKQTKSAVHFVKIMPTTHWWSLKWGGYLRESHQSGCLPQRSHNTSTFWQKIYCQLFLSYSMFTCSSMLSWKIFLYSEWRSAYSKQRDHIMCQLVSLKTMENCTIHQSKKLLWSLIRSRLFMRGSNFPCRALNGKSLVFWIGGLLWEVGTHGDSTVLFLYY